MVENIAMYKRWGFIETERRQENGDGFIGIFGQPFFQRLDITKSSVHERECGHKQRAHMGVSSQLMYDYSAIKTYI
jgi:hypothetical protein